MTVYKPEGLLIDTPENKYAMRSLTGLQEAQREGKILEARAVVCDSDHNLIVDLGFTRGIIPRNEGAIGIEDGRTRDIAIISRVNKPVCFKVLQFEKGEDGSIYPVLSRKEAQLDCARHYIAHLQLGDIITVKVTHLEAFGCFVDIGCGISSLIPIDAISISRISHPRDRFRTGQEIRAAVRSIDEEGRIGLTHKELLGTWEENAVYFAPGETVAGTIRSVESYGVFVELTPNLAGLAEPRPDAYPGQQASVYIKSLIPDKMKVKLTIVDCFDAVYQPVKPQYFVEGSHIDYWRYSPESSEKVIETVF